jgi:hypothetical protein
MLSPSKDLESVTVAMRWPAWSVLFSMRPISPVGGGDGSGNRKQADFPPLLKSDRQGGRRRREILLGQFALTVL